MVLMYGMECPATAQQTRVPSVPCDETAVKFKDGVAWRDYPNMSARVAGSKGVEFGDIVRVIQSRVGTDNNWLLCHAPTIGVKFLPLRKIDSSVPQAEQEVLFVEEDASRDDSQDIAMIDSRIRS